MRIQATLAALAIATLFAGCGKDGEVGPAGPQGNANVRSETFTVAPGSWNSDSEGLSFTHTSSLITSGIASTGTVLVYLQEGSIWVGLPLTQGGLTILYGYERGNCVVAIAGAASASQTFTFKVVAIASSGMIPEGLDVHDHEAVSAHFGLEE